LAGQFHGLRCLQQGEFNPKKFLGQPAAKAKLKGVRVVWIGRPKGNPFKFFLHGFGSGPLAFEAGRAKGKTDFRFFLSTFWGAERPGRLTLRQSSLKNTPFVHSWLSSPRHKFLVPI
jgi:hypothetical protein